MQKVKEELMLSAIFVGKWLTLGLGAIGVLYLAINLAYHKSYFDPRMEKFDLEISELQEKINKLNNSIEVSNNELTTSKEKIGKLEVDELPKAKRQVEKAENKIDSLGLSWLEKLPNPLREKNISTKNAYKELKKSEDNEATIAKKLKNAIDKRDVITESISKISDKIQNLEENLSDMKYKKKRAEVDVKGPLLWLVGFLGFAF